MTLWILNLAVNTISITWLVTVFYKYITGTPTIDCTSVHTFHKYVFMQMCVCVILQRRKLVIINRVVTFHLNHFMKVYCRAAGLTDKKSSVRGLLTSPHLWQSKVFSFVLENYGQHRNVIFISGKHSQIM